TAEEAATSGVMEKILRPTGWSQKNISRRRKPRGASATRMIRTVPRIRTSATPELPRGEAGAFRHRVELEPGHARVRVVEPDAGGGKSTIRAGDHVLAPHDAGEADDPLGDELGVLHEVGGVADDPGDQDQPVGRPELLEHVVL